MLAAERNIPGNALHYMKIYHHIRQMVVSGQWLPGSKVPILEELAELFGMSRLTARHAIGLLVKEGFLEIRRGKGTYVLEQPEEPSMIFRGQTYWPPQYWPIEGTVTEILFEEDNILALPSLGPEASLVGSYHRMKRTHSVNGQRYGLVDLYIDQVVFDETPDAFRTEPILTVLNRRPNLPFFEAKQTITCTRADLEASEQLRVPLGDALMAIRRLVIDGGKVLYLGFIRYRPEFVKLEIDLITRQARLASED
jgi:GntR family transcriptional regulator